MQNTISSINTLLKHYIELKDRIKKENNSLQNEFLRNRLEYVETIIYMLNKELDYYSYLQKQF